MPRRKESETVQTGLRMKEQLRARLEEAAREHGVSLNAEVVTRLERSFAQEEAFGSPAAKQVAYLTAVAFNMAGRMRGSGRSDWVDDPGCYRAGVFAAIDALLSVLPKSTPEEIKLEIEVLKGKAMTRQLREQGLGQ
jgi:Arc-like DNA binding domain